MHCGTGLAPRRPGRAGDIPETKTRNKQKSTDTTMNEKQPTALTRGEEEIMQILWRLGNAVVNDIIASTEEPHPKYTTVATFLKILENKGFVRHTSEGKSHRYWPAVSKEEYARSIMSTMLDSYFDGSLVQLVSFFSRHEQLSAREMDEILEIMRQAGK